MVEQTTTEFLRVFPPSALGHAEYHQSPRHAGPVSAVLCNYSKDAVVVTGSVVVTVHSSGAVAGS